VPDLAQPTHMTPTWRTSNGPGEPLRWAPLVDIGNAGLVVGLAEDGERWVIGERARDEGECLLLAPGKAKVALLPLLEQTPSDFYIGLRTSLLAAGFDAEKARQFPIVLAADGATRARSSYWIELLLEWIEVLSAEDRRRVLHVIVSAPWASQVARHRAQRALTTG